MPENSTKSAFQVVESVQKVIQNVPNARNMYKNCTELLKMAKNW